MKHKGKATISINGNVIADNVEVTISYGKKRARSYAIFNGKELVDVVSDRDTCHPYGLCGGCGACLLQQAAYYGYTIKPIRPEEYPRKMTPGDILGEIAKTL